jgi:23S rRNA (cytidine1920-2'-O)/16S rRNA (cytidine1409-2'-O)-methyltransferase
VPRHRARFVALVRLLAERFPSLGDPEDRIRCGDVVVDGRIVTNVGALVRADAAVRIVARKPLRGFEKLAPVLGALRWDLAGGVAVDLGAAAGGFTAALLAAGVKRVHAGDVGHGQLAGWLAADERVVVHERVNVADLCGVVVADVVDVVAMDLSYLSVAAAVGQLDGRLALAPDARLIALVKPTFELGRGSLAVDPPAVRSAVERAAAGVAAAGWQPLGCVPSPIRGARGAVEVFVLARRLRPSAGVWRGSAGRGSTG